MTIAEAQLRLDAAMGHPAAVAELARRKALEERRLRQRVQHEIRLATIRREGAEKVAAIKAKHAELRRVEERAALAALDMRMALARGNRALRGQAIPLDLALRWHQTRVERCGTVVPEDEPFIPVWRAHADALLREFNIECTWEPAAAGVNAYAFTSVGRSKCRRSSPQEVTSSSCTKWVTPEIHASRRTSESR